MNGDKTTQTSDEPAAISVPALRAGDRATLARAITLIESRRGDHRKQAQELLQELLPLTGNSVRVGLTGVPGVGKSTAIDTLGTNLTAAGHRVAVLAVDPSSTRTGGSILGDKTRMERLARDDNAFIRPSPTSGTLGGVGARTRETMLVCEAAGFDIILVETVGIGQSEITVAEMVDFFAVLALPGAGDELQGLKKGVLEIADLIAVNKADGARAQAASRAAAEYRAALHILTPQSPNWQPPVLLISGRENEGLDTMWAKVLEHRRISTESGELSQRRRHQQVKWMWSLLDDRLRAALHGRPELRARLTELEVAVREGALTPSVAVDEIAGRLGL